MTLADPPPTPDSQGASAYAHRFGTSPPLSLGVEEELLLVNGDSAFDELERILRDGNGADDQRRVHREAGMNGLLDYLAERTRRR